MPDIEHIILPDGVTYNLSDSGALHLTDLPSTAGTYVLQVTIIEGLPTYTWVTQTPSGIDSFVFKSSWNYMPTITTHDELNYTVEITENDS